MGHHGTRISLKPFIFNIYRTSWDGIKQEFGALSGTRTQDNFYALIILFNDLLNKMLWKVMNMGMKCIISRIHAYFGHVY